MNDTAKPEAVLPEIAALLEGPAREVLPQALPSYLARQRWFGSKSKTIQSARLMHTTVLDEVNCALTVVEVTYLEGAPEMYQVPLAVATGQAAEDTGSGSSPATIATINTAEGSFVLHDAVYSAPFRARLLELSAASPIEAASLPSKISSAEQSNTSIFYGDRYVLKLYRRVQPGNNPDVEIPQFLASVADFHSTPAYLGQLQSHGTTLTFLQRFAPNHGDGWKWMMEQLAGFYGAVAGRPAPRGTATAPSFAGDVSADPEVEMLAEESLAAAVLLGRRTAELHLALATPTEDVDFAAEAFTPNDLAADSTRIHQQIVAALDAVKQHMAQVPADLVDRAAALLGQRKQLLERAHALATASPYRFGRRIRIHGDYHLGQVLRTDDDFLIVDFEGEPARPLEERRRKQSPLRDVAGMLRSFSYVAFASLSEYRGSSGAVDLDAWATAWERAASSAFLSEYRNVIAAHPELLPQPDQAQALLLALLIEKALYELLYELNNRPSWLRIPLGGVLALLREAA